MQIEERINHVQYALDRREAILKSKIDRRFPVSVFVVYRRVALVEQWRDELYLISKSSSDTRVDALELLNNIEEAVFGVL